MQELLNNKKQTIKLINEGLKMFEPRSNGKGVCFTMEAIQGESKLHRKLSDLIYNADCATDTAYTFVNEALEILSEIIEYSETEDELQDAISEQADSYTPIYNSEIMEFVRDNPYLVGDAIDELGKQNCLLSDGQGAYYLGLERMVYSVAEVIEGLL